MYFLYSFLAAIFALVAAPYFVWKGLRTGKYLSSLGQRMGSVPGDVLPKIAAGAAIWVHAVSVGEVIAAVPLARLLKQQFPRSALVISTTTQTGQKMAQERVGFVDAVFYFPFDWAWMVRRTLRAIRPSSVIILETEIWPNFLREARRSRVPVVFANGRISDKGFRKYQSLFSSLGILRGFFKRVLANASLFLMQTESDAERIRALGAASDRVVVTGNLKYDAALPAISSFEIWLKEVLDGTARRPLIVAGSVVAGEEKAILEAFAVVKGRMPGAFLMLAPRKPERFEDAASEITQAGLQFVRRSTLALDRCGPNGLGPGADVLLLDTIGELAGAYRLADLVFIGGSLVAAGGHNILEPAAFGKGPVFGPSMENFRDIARAFLDRGAARQVQDARELGGAWLELMENPGMRDGMAEAARAIVDANRGATARTLARIVMLLGQNSDATAGKIVREPAAASTTVRRSGS